MVSFCWKKPTQKKPTTKCQQVQKDLTNLQPLNTKEDLIKAYPDRFEGIGLQNDARPIVHAPQKCPIAMQSLVCEKLDDFLEQGIIVPVEEPTD